MAPPVRSAEDWNQQGIAFAQQGWLTDAVGCFRQAVALRPDFFQAHSNLGIALQDLGQVDEAIACYQRATQIRPDYAMAYNYLGTAFHERKLFDQAVACYRRVLELDPHSASAHSNLGSTLREQGKAAEAATAYRRALELRPDSAAELANLGIALHELGEEEEAERCLVRAVQLDPNSAVFHSNLGTVLHGQGRLGEAAAGFRRALELDPHFAAAFNNLGAVLHDMGETAEGIRCYEEAIRLDPRHTNAHANLGHALKERGRLVEAAACYQRALAVGPASAKLWANLAVTRRSQGQLEEAIAYLRHADQLEPENAGILLDLIHTRQLACDWDGLEPQALRAIELVIRRAEDRDSRDAASPFSFLALPVPTTADQQLRCARLYAAQTFKSVRVTGPGLPAGRPARAGGKIRLGYLSADLRVHPVGNTVVQFLELHDRQRFEVIAYSYGPDDGSAVRRRIEKAVDQFVDIRAVPNGAAAARIAADGVDILIDLTGFTGDTRTDILARRPAPIQVNYWGYAGTLGTPFADYVLVDDFIAPPEEQPHFTEKLVHLPICYLPHDTAREIAPHRPTRQECGLPEEGFVFCSFNNTYKINPLFFSVWMDILKAVPGSVLWLLEGNRLATANLRKEAEARGVAGERVVFARRVPLPEYLALHGQADLFLDNYPYNAHTTACDALYAGCPLVTLAGQTFSSRVAGSLLRSVGLPELITTSLEEYRDLVLTLARSPDRLAALRARLAASRSASPFFDGRRFARDLENAYLGMLDETGRPND